VIDRKQTSTWPQNTVGTHLLVEYSGCDHVVLDDLELIRNLMLKAAAAAGTIVVGSLFKPFQPHGVTGVVIIEESHLSIHTWPEHGYAAVDFFTCGQGVAEFAHDVLFIGLQADSAECLHIDRGLAGCQLMSVRSHEIQTKLHRFAVQGEAIRSCAG
jgi:S-adenosylmethionine decarboxylase